MNITVLHYRRVHPQCGDVDTGASAARAADVEVTTSTFL